MRSPLSALASLPVPTAALHNWLLICYCPGLDQLALPADAAASQVAGLLHSRGYTRLAQLVTGPLPEGVGLVLALDIPLGEAPGLCVMRTHVTQMRGWAMPFEYSVALTQLLGAAVHWVPAAQTALLLLPQAPTTGSMAPLFPSTTGILAALPPPAHQPRLGMAPEEPQQTALLNAVEVGLALSEARREGGSRLQLLLSENCLHPSLETAYQLHEETEYFAPLRCGGAGHVLEAIVCLLEREQSWLASPAHLLPLLLSAADAATRAPQTPLPWQGWVMDRMMHLFFLCTQLTGHSQALWQEDRAIQTAFLLSTFQARAKDDDYRDLFALAHGLQFELHRLPFAAMERIDPVMLSQLTDNLAEILKVQRNQQPLFLLPAEGKAKPHLPVYLPTAPPRPEFQLLHFAQGGWSQFIQLLHAARS